MQPRLSDLTPDTDFIRRHIGPDDAERAAMLAELGYDSIDALIDDVVPAGIRDPEPGYALPATSEAAALAALEAIAAENRLTRSLIGQGYYNTHTPAVILRNVLENPGWYTAYTPYQPEISQGRLEALLNFQTLVTDLTGLDIANASLLDEATAAAEAMALCRRVAKSKSGTFFVDADCLPQTIAVLYTRAAAAGVELVIGDPLTELADCDCFGALLQYPGTSGEVRDFTGTVEALHARGALAVVAADILALTLLQSPAAIGADIAIGSTQRFGVPLGFGGPHAAYMATRESFKRSLPGRLVGVSVDSAGNPAYRLALQTREQHIRREKATSNICTAQVLLAVMAAMYAVYHGPDGLRRIAKRCHALACVFRAGLAGLGFDIVHETFFDTLTIRTGEQTAAIHERAVKAGFNLRRIDMTTLGISFDETVTPAEIEVLWRCFDPSSALTVEEVEPRAGEHLPDALCRDDTILTHPVFHRYQSETEMLRYLRTLADRDIALDRAMIPLGSCTMKLNATAEMLPVTWRRFADVHPLAPADQAAGYRRLVDELERALCAVTGYEAVSMQPNAGSQGEYAGLLAIRGWHASRGESERDICLIPASAHGTNPASAQMCGMRVVVVPCDRNGNVDLAELKRKLADNEGKIAAIMITYPSTHGVFEEQVVELCELVHAAGGQVYIDGANLNAMVGLCRPGLFGGDVSHLNLHKTFCIPHGGGGPGVGPVAVKAHLAPYLPGDPYSGPTVGDQVGAVSAAPNGSAGILPISWMYIRMMGTDGLKQATEAAILNANYIAARLADHYPVLYTGSQGRVAHECIIDLRHFKESCGIEVEDVAKRLIDYGFHAPTMSFPVPGTLMIEPTESESKAELDRFCEAMIAIRAEIAAVEAGEADAEDNPLKRAPHTAQAVGADEWAHRYSRQEAAWPVEGLAERKYWPPVGRIDNVYGDRNLVCSCPPMADYRD